jgi:hypothetical protein
MAKASQHYYLNFEEFKDVTRQLAFIKALMHANLNLIMISCKDWINNNLGMLII